MTTPRLEHLHVCHLQTWWTVQVHQHVSLLLCQKFDHFAMCCTMLRVVRSNYYYYYYYYYCYYLFFYFFSFITIIIPMVNMYVTFGFENYFVS